jgi:hypothetical protein
MREMDGLLPCNVVRWISLQNESDALLKEIVAEYIAEVAKEMSHPGRTTTLRWVNSTKEGYVSPPQAVDCW